MLVDRQGVTSGNAYLFSNDAGTAAALNGILQINSNRVFFYPFDGVAQQGTPTTLTIPTTAGVATHIAFSKQGQTCRTFIGGQLGATRQDASSFTTPQKYFVGAAASSLALTQFRIDEFRLTNGVALYTQPFTPPTQPFAS